MLSLSCCPDPCKLSECPALLTAPFTSLLSPSSVAVQALLCWNVAQGHCQKQNGNVQDCSTLDSFSFRYNWEPFPSKRISDFSSGLIIKNVINLARSEIPICIPFKYHSQKLEAFPCAHFARESLLSTDDCRCSTTGLYWLSVGFPPHFSPPRNLSLIVQTVTLLCRCLD